MVFCHMEDFCSFLCDNHMQYIAVDKDQIWGSDGRNWTGRNPMLGFYYIFYTRPSDFMHLPWFPV